MTEDDYISISDLTKMRMAYEILRHVSGHKVRDARAHLDRAISDAETTSPKLEASE